MRLMSRRRYNMKAAKTSEMSPIVTKSGPGASADRIDRKQHLEAQQRIECDVEQKAGQHCRDRGRPLGVGVGQPGVQGGEPHFGAVAEQEENESEIEQGRIEFGGAHNQAGPDHGIGAFAHDRPGGHVDQNGTEQCERYADASQDEIFPSRFERLVGAVDADHQHGSQCRKLDRDPHQPDIVGDQREVHGEHQHLVHRVIEPQKHRREAPDLQLMPYVAGAEHARRESHERGEHDEDVIEIIDVEIRSLTGPMEEQ
jgi:hypothetical protein